MGTSASSTGPNNKSPLIPSWAEQGDPVTIETASGTDGDEQAGSDNNQADDQNDNSNDIDNDKVQQEIGGSPTATPPPNMFASARRAFGKYAQTGGSTSDLRRSLKSYSRKGSGGGKSTSRRLSSGITAGSGLLGVMRGDTVTVNNQSLSLGDLTGLSTDCKIQSFSAASPNKASIRSKVNWQGIPIKTSIQKSQPIWVGL